MKALDKINYATVREGFNPRANDIEFHLECRFSNWDKYAPIIVDAEHEDLAHEICNLLNKKYILRFQTEINVVIRDSDFGKQVTTVVGPQGALIQGEIYIDDLKPGLVNEIYKCEDMQCVGNLMKDFGLTITRNTTGHYI